MGGYDSKFYSGGGFSLFFFSLFECIQIAMYLYPCLYPYKNSSESVLTAKGMGIGSVLKSGPVWFFALQGLRPRPRPVLQIPEAAKNRTGPRSSVFCGSRTVLTGPGLDWSLTSLNRSSGVQEVTQQIYFMYFMYETNYFMYEI